MLTKIDLKKELKHLYAPSAKDVQLVTVPEFDFVMIDGRIEPHETPERSTAFREAMMAVYGLSFTLKFMSKRRKENPVDFTVMAVEGLWWTESGGFDPSATEPLYWTLMMMQPKHITATMYAEALAQLREKKDSPALTRVRFGPFHEGLCMQTMHVGPYSAEAATLARMRAFAHANGLGYRGRHHEIYLGDPRRSAPEKLRTILRQPVEKIS